jgi:hypothetical protein
MGIPVRHSPESSSNRRAAASLLAAAGFLAVTFMVARGGLFGGTSPVEAPVPGQLPEAPPSATATVSAADLQEQLRQEACRFAEERHLPLPPGLEC